MSSRLALLALIASLALQVSFAQSPVDRRAVPAVARPTLVVFITVDQMRADYFRRFESQLQGGLSRMYKGGAFFAKGFQDHGITETAPGHASTMSGRFPVHTGIADNVAGVSTRAAPLIDAGEMGASPFRFQGTTLIDWIKGAQPSMRFLSVSRKDRGAILPIGRTKGDVYWYSANGTFTTSRYYADSLPGWVRAFNARHLPQSFAGKAWTTLLPSSKYAEPDSIALESVGVDFTFPHLAPADSAGAAGAAAGFPWMDDITLALALAGVKELGLGDSSSRTDVLAVSLSALDAVGHRFGPDSRELHDQVLRLDRALGTFLDSLDRMRDTRRIVVALAGDHGMTPFPDLKSSIYPNRDAKRVNLDNVWRTNRSRMIEAGVDSMAMTFEGGIFSVRDAAAFTKASVDVDSAAARLAADALVVQGVLRADLLTSLAKADTTRDAIARRWLHTFAPNGAVRMIVTLTPYSYWEDVRYATHGSPHDSDANVPVLFYGAGVRPGRYPDVVRVVDMAPTLAALVGVKPLELLDGRVLRQVIR